MHVGHGDRSIFILFGLAPRLGIALSILPLKFLQVHLLNYFLLSEGRMLQSPYNKDDWYCISMAYASCRVILFSVDLRSALLHLQIDENIEL